MNTTENKNGNSEKEFDITPIDIPYQAGQQAKDDAGANVNSDDFHFVQQDKRIHDIKFTTKPTTFFKDAMHRFSKNHSSVTGAIILGILFVLAIVVPIDGVVPYDMKLTPSGQSLNYETNLPPKLGDFGNGFWDGTRLFKNQPYPYDSQGNYNGAYPSDTVIKNISNIKEGYTDNTTYIAEGNGGYAVLDADIATTGDAFVYTYSFKYNYAVANTYDLSYQLGWKEKDGYIKPQYAVLFLYNDTYTNLTDYTDDYGTAGTTEGDQTVTPYEAKTLDVSAALKAKFPTVTTFANASLGILMKTSTTAKTELFLKNFVITSSSSSRTEAAALSSRSFTDGNTVVGEKQYKDDKTTLNTSYWKTNSRLTVSDVATKVCDILYDMYAIAYGLRSDITIARSVFDDWISKGYLTWDYANPTFGDLVLTDAGKASGAVYVKSVQKQNTESGVDKITLNCTVVMYEWLGYKQMPLHILGTESKGKDLFRYVFSGLRTSLLLGFVVSLINIIIGVVWGSISGYFGGITDLAMERFVEILSGIPWIVLMTVLTLTLGQNFFVFALALCLTGWIGVEAITRSQFYRYRGREYVLAARTLGAKAPRLIFRHILPNAIGTIVTSTVLMIPSVIFSEATISYLGLGLKDLDSLGVILSTNQANLKSYPYQLIFPAVIISLLMICFNLFGNGLRDAFNPSLKGEE